MSDRVELTGMVLSAQPVGEYDKRLVLLTKERGKISGFAKGARRQNSPLLAAAKPFSFGTFECFEGRSSYNIYQAQITNYFEKLSLDFEGAYLGMYFLEFADYYTRENNDEREMLKLLYVTMRALENGHLDKKLVRYIYELRAMVINGEYPQMFTCVNCGTTENLRGYVHAKNGVLCADCCEKPSKIMVPGTFSIDYLSDAAIYALQYVISTPIEKLYAFTLTPEVLTEFKRIVERFRNTYIDKRFKTLEIIEMLDI